MRRLDWSCIPDPEAALSNKRALIVDDAKSARVALSRVLTAYAIEVDFAESAEAALEHLRSHRPDAIFMDQQMPGMDGLQALKIIKNDPRTATIPVMMYTAQEGDVYVGQARALGAVGVLPKQVTSPIDIKTLLLQLRLLPDREEFADTSPSISVPVELAQPARPAEPPVAPPVRDAEPVPIERQVRSAVEPLLEAQLPELRRMMAASVESLTTRVLTKLHDVFPAPAELAPPPKASGRSAAWMAVAGLIAGVLVASGAVLLRQAAELDDLRARLAAAERTGAAAEAQSAERAAAIDAARSALQSLAAAFNDRSGPPVGNERAGPPRPAAPAATSSTGTRLVLPFGYGEPPLAGARLEALRMLSADLEQRGVSGIVHVTTFAADFCLIGTAGDYQLAPDDLAIKSCDLTGNPYDDTATGRQRESAAFSEFVAALPRRSNNRLSIVTDKTEHPEPVAPYPATPDATAGQWNEAATANQRVEIYVTAKAAAPEAAH